MKCFFLSLKFAREFPDNQAENLSLMLESLWNVLHPRGYLLTMAAGANNLRANDRYNVPHISQHVDFINIVKFLSFMLF